MYKLSFLLHSLLDNGARMTPKCRSVFSLIFIVDIKQGWLNYLHLFGGGLSGCYYFFFFFFWSNKFSSIRQLHK